MHVYVLDSVQKCGHDPREHVVHRSNGHRALRDVRDQNRAVANDERGSLWRPGLQPTGQCQKPFLSEATLVEWARRLMHLGAPVGSDASRPGS